jgi:5-methylcytosine-specific restriction endonuclease McrA
MLNSRVLVLNRSYLPINVTSAKRAFIMIYAGIAKVVDSEFRTFDFQTWADLDVQDQHESIGLVNKLIRIPRVIIVVTFDSIPKRQVKFNRYNIFARDNWTCQYCGKHKPKSELNLDHVVPRSLGGMSSWENVVCSCLKCNMKKGGRTPKQANMKLKRRPRKPSWIQSLQRAMSVICYQEWEPFLSPLNRAYWSVELDE